MKKHIILLAIVALLCAACGESKKSEGNFAKYATVEIGTESSSYTDAISIYGKEVLNLYRFAAMEADNIYWKQVFGNKQSLESIEDENLREYAMINYGPWDRISGKSFLPGFSDQPAGMLFYPSDMTEQEWDAFDSPDKYSPYTLIKRNAEGQLETV